MIRLLGSSFDHANSPLVIFKVIKKTGRRTDFRRCHMQSLSIHDYTYKDDDNAHPRIFSAGTEYEILKSFKLNAELV